MADFGLVESFGIDGGELDGLTPQECFVLGYEHSEVSRLLESESGPISKLVHGANKDRIGTKCRESGRQYCLNWMKGDKSEEWMVLTVSARESSL